MTRKEVSEEITKIFWVKFGGLNGVNITPINIVDDTITDFMIELEDKLFFNTGPVHFIDKEIKNAREKK